LSIVVADKIAFGHVVRRNGLEKLTLEGDSLAKDQEECRLQDT